MSRLQTTDNLCIKEAMTKMQGMARMFSLNWPFKRRTHTLASVYKSPAEVERLWAAVKTQQALACSVQQLCWICEQLVNVAVDGNSPPEAQRLAERLPIQIDLVRRSAERIGMISENQNAVIGTEPDPYSLPALSELMRLGPAEHDE